MREIKFKIWDTEEKKFFKPIYEAWKGDLLDLSISLSGELIRRTMVHCAEHESQFPDRYKIMQFTGLHDKNGVEIYEGDIINIYGEVRVVSFEKGWWMTFSPMEFYKMYQSNGYLPAGFATLIEEDDYRAIKPMYRYGSPEVIGNIYEHSHLLNKEQEPGNKKHNK